MRGKIAYIVVVKGSNPIELHSLQLWYLDIFFTEISI